MKKLLKKTAITTLLFVLIMLFFSSCASAVTEIVHFTFDQGGGSIVSNMAKDGIPGKLFGSAGLAAGYNSTGSITFNPNATDNSGYIELGFPKDVIFKGATIVCRLKNYGQTTYGRLWHGFPSHYNFAINEKDHPSFWFYGTDDLPSSLTVPQDGKWHFLAMTIDGKEAVVYLDDKTEKLTTVGPDGQRKWQDNIAWFGGIPDGSKEDWDGFDRPFHGAMDDIRIFNGALSEDDVKAIKAGTYKPEEGSIAYAPENVDLKSSHGTVITPLNGRIARLGYDVKVFVDSDERLAYIPRQIDRRKFVMASKNSVRAVCKKSGYLAAIAPVNSKAMEELKTAGFERLDYPEFDAFIGDKETKALALQKHVKAGEKLEFNSWVLLIFGTDNRSGVPESELKGLAPSVMLPDGSEFMTWEKPLRFSKTYYVDQNHKRASDDNPGTKDRPFKTINQAAQILQPGERVVVATGIYREWVRPARGGTAPDKMISYEAAPGSKVVIKGSEILKGNWKKSLPWFKPTKPLPWYHGMQEAWTTDQGLENIDKVYMIRLPDELFGAYNPFGVRNYIGVGGNAPANQQVRGMIFQDGKRLKQMDPLVSAGYLSLFKEEGSFWVDPSGMILHVFPYGQGHPSNYTWEITTRQQVFAPEEFYLPYIRVKGFTMEYAGNGFPMPQFGLLSTNIGHHWIIEDNTIRWANGVGIDIGKHTWDVMDPEINGYHIIRRNTVTDCGVGGIQGHGDQEYGNLVEDNLLLRNCWQNVEGNAESGAIKMLHNENALIRRNIVIDTRYGPGIWIDYDNYNTRLCQNVVIGTKSGIGGIFWEASLRPNMIDNNFVWGTDVNGIYEHTTGKLTIANNFVGNCGGTGLMLRGGPRQVGIRITPGGEHKVFNNILVNNSKTMEIHGPPSIVKNNLTEGISAEFDSETLELTWKVDGEIPKCEPVEGITHDFWTRPIKADVLPGPFGFVPSEIKKIKVDPRLSKN